MKDAAKELFEVRFPRGSGAAGVDVTEKALAGIFLDAGLPPTGRNTDAYQVSGRIALPTHSQLHAAARFACEALLSSPHLDPLVRRLLPHRWLEAAPRL